MISKHHLRALLDMQTSAHLLRCDHAVRDLLSSNEQACHLLDVQDVVVEDLRRQEDDVPA